MGLRIELKSGKIVGNRGLEIKLKSGKIVEKMWENRGTFFILKMVENDEKNGGSKYLKYIRFNQA